MKVAENADGEALQAVSHAKTTSFSFQNLWLCLKFNDRHRF